MSKNKVAQRPGKEKPKLAPMSPKATRFYHAFLEVAVEWFFGSEGIDQLRFASKWRAHKVKNPRSMMRKSLETFFTPLREHLRKDYQEKINSLTLADLAIAWKDGDRDCRVTGEELSIALGYMWRWLNDGRGTFKVFTESDLAIQQIFNAGILASSLGSGEVEQEALDALNNLLMDVRARCSLVIQKPSARDYHVQIVEAQPAAAQAA